MMQVFDMSHLFQGSSQVDLWCQADHYWEFCRWIHKDRYCDYEYMSGRDHVQTTACDFPEGKVRARNDLGSFFSSGGIRIMVHHLMS